MRPPAVLRLAILLLGAAVTIAGCSRIGVAYNTADFFIKGYAKDQLDLDRSQLASWQPMLDAALERHRQDELPYLAAYFDQLLQTSRQGFTEQNAVCAINQFRSLYQRQATMAVALAAPLLADLTPSQIRGLERRFNEEDNEDRAKLAHRDAEAHKSKRARRYVKSVEDWTGALRDDQKAIVHEITARMPETQASLVAYRSMQRQRLIAMLDAKADQAAIETFLAAWLTDFKDMPAELSRGGSELEARLAELVVRIGASLDARQREHLEKRLRSLRNDLMKLQREPRVASLSC